MKNNDIYRATITEPLERIIKRLEMAHGQDRETFIAVLDALEDRLKIEKVL